MAGDETDMSSTHTTVAIGRWISVDVLGAPAVRGDGRREEKEVDEKMVKWKLSLQHDSMFHHGESVPLGYVPYYSETTCAEEGQWRALSHGATTISHHLAPIWPLAQYGSVRTVFVQICESVFDHLLHSDTPLGA